MAAYCKTPLDEDTGWLLVTVPNSNQPQNTHWKRYMHWKYFIMMSFLLRMPSCIIGTVRKSHGTRLYVWHDKVRQMLDCSKILIRVETISCLAVRWEVTSSFVYSSFVYYHLPTRFVHILCLLNNYRLLLVSICSFVVDGMESGRKHLLLLYVSYQWVV